MAKNRGGRVRPRDQGRQSEKRRFSAESGGGHRGGASGDGRYGQKRPGRGASLANEPSAFRLFGKLETLGILFYLLSQYRPVCLSQKKSQTNSQKVKEQQ